MYSYEDKDGVTIKVSQEHLEAATTLKLELQKLHGGRTPWRKLVTMMLEDGFEGAEHSENYRQMIKRYQKNTGTLPDATTYAERVSTSKLQSLKNAVGELAETRQDVMNHTREFNRIKRELANYSILAEEIAEAVANNKVDLSGIGAYIPKEEIGGKVVVSVLSDWHVGAVVDSALNTYNFDIAKDMINHLAYKVVEKAKAVKADTIYVVSIGDLVEQITMRYAQAFDVEFTFAEQVVKAQELVLTYLLQLRANGFDGKIFFTGIAGNHDRIESDKKKNLYGDSVATIVNYYIESQANINGLSVEYLEADTPLRTHLEINGENYKFVHGDYDNLKDESVLGKFAQYDGREYVAIIGGHVHHKRVVEVGLNKYNITMPSGKGSDDFSDSLKTGSAKSQGLLVINGEGLIDEICFVDLEPENVYREGDSDGESAD